MKLGEARTLFRELQSKTIRVRQPAWRDHPKRNFSEQEIVQLVRVNRGVLLDNKMPSAISGSFLWCCFDALERKCELVVLFEKDISTGKYILIVSAWREI